MFRGKGVKFTFRVTVVSASGLPENELVSVHYKRGEKAENQGETTRKVVFDGRVTWNESVSMQCTLFQADSAGKYDPKEMLFTLRKFSNKSAVAGSASDKFAVLGRIGVDISRFAGVSAAGGGAPQTKMLAVRSLQKKGLFTLNVTLSATLESEAADDEPPSEVPKSSFGDASAGDPEVAEALGDATTADSTTTTTTTPTPAAAAAGASLTEQAAAVPSSSPPAKGKSKKSSKASAAVAAATSEVRLSMLTEVLDAALEGQFVPPGMPKTAFVLLKHMSSLGSFESPSVKTVGPVVAALATCRKVHAWSFSAVMHWVSTALWLVREVTPRLPPHSAVKEPFRVSRPSHGVTEDPESLGADKWLLRELRTFLYDCYMTALERAYRDLRVSVQSMADPSRAPPGSSPAAARRAAQLSILGVFTQAHECMMEAKLPESIRIQYFGQLSHFVNTTVLSLISTMPELCTCRSGLHIKLELSQVDEWLSKDPPLFPVRARFEQLREAANLLAMNKDILLDEVATRSTFPALTWPFIHKIVTTFVPDEFAKQRVDQNVLRSVAARAQKVCAPQSEDPYAFVAE